MNTGKNSEHKESEKHSFDLEQVRNLSLLWVLGLPPSGNYFRLWTSKTVRESGCPMPVLEVIRVHGKVMR